MWQGYKNILSVDDLDALPPDVRTSHVCDAFLKSWSKEKAKARYSTTSLISFFYIYRVTQKRVYKPNMLSDKIYT